MEQQDLFTRVKCEYDQYNNAFDAAVDHLQMAHSHLFEEFEGRDMHKILTEIDWVITKIKDLNK